MFVDLLVLLVAVWGEPIIWMGFPLFIFAFLTLNTKIDPVLCDLMGVGWQIVNTMRFYMESTSIWYYIAAKIGKQPLFVFVFDFC